MQFSVLLKSAVWEAKHFLRRRWEQSGSCWPLGVQNGQVGILGPSQHHETCAHMVSWVNLLFVSKRNASLQIYLDKRSIRRFCLLFELLTGLLLCSLSYSLLIHSLICRPGWKLSCFCTFSVWQSVEKADCETWSATYKLCWSEQGI